MAMLDPDPGFWSKTSCIQLGYGIWVNLATFSIGLAHGFPAIQVPQLNRPECTIIVTVAEISWIASVLTLFSPVGCILSGFMMDRFGRKPMIVICELPMCIGWIYTGLANEAFHIIIGRAITGIGCGMAMGAPRLYTAEISLANMRGVLGAFPNTFISLGMTIQATMGSFLPWDKISIICGVFSGCLFFSYLFLGETPYYLLLRGSEENAKKALCRYRDKSYNIEAELEELLEFKQENNIRSLSLKEKIGALLSVSCCRPFAILMMYVMIGAMSGISFITFWTVELLMLAKTSIDAYAGNVAINSTRLVFGLLSSVLLLHIGRRTMALISAVGVGFACIALGATVHYGDSPSVLPQIIIMSYIAFSCLGFLSLPFLLMSELYPLQIRGILVSISISLTSISTFATAKSFHYFRDTVGVATSFFIFGSCSFLGALFLYFFLPETKGLTLQEIEEYFNARRPTLVSERAVLNAQLQARLREAGGATPRLSNLRAKLSKFNKSPHAPQENVVLPVTTDSSFKPLERVALPDRAERSSLKGSASTTSRKSVTFSELSSEK